MRIALGILALNEKNQIDFFARSELFHSQKSRTFELFSFLYIVSFLSNVFGVNWLQEKSTF